jgi:hypothetical protein
VIALLVGPASAAVTAFQVSARAHVVDLLLAGGLCGNPAARSGANLFLGHCATCWSAATFAGVATFLAMASILHLRATARATQLGRRAK